MAQQVPLGSVTAGMVLSRDVESADGYRILAKGTVLTDSQIGLLVRWRIDDVFVDPPAPPVDRQAPEPEPVDPVLETARRRLEGSFAGSLVNDWMLTLYAEAAKRLVAPRPWRQLP